MPCFNELWLTGPANTHSPWKELARFKRTLKLAHHKIKDSNPINILTTYCAAVRLLRILSSRDPDASDYAPILLRFPNFCELVHRGLGGWNVLPLRSFLNALLCKTGTPDPAAAGIAGNSKDASVTVDNLPSYPTANNKKANFLSELKLILPSSRSTVRALKPSNEEAPTDDPAVLGKVIQDYYFPLWKRNDKIEDDYIDNYLDDYPNRIDPEKIRNLDLATIKMAIHSAPSSSVGPDGIPFLAYKCLSDIAGPLLLSVATLLGTRQDNMRVYNRSRLVLLPKKLTHSIEDTRPICISNTDNRIISRALVICLVDAAQDLIGPHQKMFLPGRESTDHIFSLNEEFYSHWREQKEFFVLFTDNCKAFDSIDHSFILKTLVKQGFPAWIVQTVVNLLSDVWVSPSIAPDSLIPIQRGVKQGCLLSPLIFVLIYDTLLESLRRKTNLAVRGAADDLALSSSSIGCLISAFPIIDEFTRVSGMDINQKKTVILSTLEYTPLAGTPPTGPSPPHCVKRPSSSFPSLSLSSSPPAFSPSTPLAPARPSSSPPSFLDPLVPPFALLLPLALSSTHATHRA